MAETYGLKGSFHFMYGERYGWGLRFHRGGRFVLAMYPNQGHLTVQIILGRAQVTVATAMALPPRIVRVLEAAKDYPEGRWLFIPVKSGKSAKELRSLGTAAAWAGRPIVKPRHHAKRFVSALAAAGPSLQTRSSEETRYLTERSQIS
jgi:hypothetical protein